MEYVFLLWWRFNLTVYVWNTQQDAHYEDNSGKMPTQFWLIDRACLYLWMNEWNVCLSGTVLPLIVD
jgi:hypothetical protein